MQFKNMQAVKMVIVQSYCKRLKGEIKNLME